MQIDDRMMEAEHQLELVAAGINNDRVAELMKSDRVAESIGGKSLVKRGVTSLSVALDDWIASHSTAKRGPNALKYLTMLGSEETSVILMRCMLGMMARTAKSKPTSYHSTVQMVAERVLMAISSKIYEDQDSKAADSLARRLDWQPKAYVRMRMAEEVFKAECVELTVSDTDSLALGTTLIELFIATLGLFETYTRGTGKSQTKLVRATPKADEWMADATAMNLAIESYHLPMVIEPFAWTTLTDGGYLLPHLHQSSLVRVSQGGAGWRRLEQANLDTVMTAVNTIQATPWRLNKRVLKVWRALVGSGLAGMSQSEPIVIPESVPKGEPGHDIAREARRGAYEQLNQNRATTMAESQKERLATLMEPYEAFYYPHNVDFRGRVYPLCGVGAINPQGDDAGKALLEFAEGKALGEDGLQWLYIHAQNCWGNDKVSLQARIDATTANLDEYSEYAADPLANQGWMQADKPFGFLAVCFELADIATLGSAQGYLSRVPVALDGTCSGLQHFAGLMLDEGLAKAVNVVGSGDTPNDIYQDVVCNVNRLLSAKGDTEAEYWTNKVTRLLVKQPVMTLSYGVTASGMRSQIAEMCKKLAFRKGQPEYALGSTTGYPAYLTELVLESISAISTSAFDVMQWLREVAKANANASPDSITGATHWVSPVGLPVTQEYYAHDSKRVNVLYEGRRIRFTRRTGAVATDKGKQAQGAAPNFIHSMDAAHLMLTVIATEEAAGEPLSFAMIHDSFGTHAADTGLLFEVLREEFASIYRKDALMQLYALLEPEVKLEVGLPPVRGELDLDLVQASEYLFS